MKLPGKLGIILAAVIAVGCTSAANKTSAGFSDAAMSPLTDLNLRRIEVPALLEAIKSPYEPIPDVSCVGIGMAVVELTKILGRDSDAEPLPEKSMGDQVGDGAADLTLNTVSSTMSDFIPFRGLVREATGASAHDRKLRDAYERGIQRRAYLKGVGAQLGCAPPAAPEPNAGIPVAPKIEYRNNEKPKPVTRQEFR